MLPDNNNCSPKMQKCLDYIQSLEEERRKIQVFQRELPLCLDLVSQAIEKCKEEFDNQKQIINECSEQTSSEGPVLEEFMPMKRASSSDEDEQQHSKKTKIVTAVSNRSEKSSKKSDWLRSVQLWNQTPDPPTNKQESPRKVTVVEVNKNGNGGAFHPFKREEKGAAVEAPPAAAGSSTAETGGSSGGCKGEDKEDSHRKARRCWSPELHRRFLQALQQLGGAHVATPKQIRELMKVDGLTNDEVKSHLQKYRLHTRRPSSSSNTTTTTQAPQFVVVGGIWVPPPPEYTSTAATSSDAGPIQSSPPSEIYAPKATLPKALTEAAAGRRKQKQTNETDYSDKNGSNRNTRSRCNSPATSSSTHTTTASPAY